MRKRAVPLGRAVPPADVPARLPWRGDRWVPSYLVEVGAPVRLEPAVLQSRREAFRAVRHIDGVLRHFGFTPSPDGGDAFITLTATKGGRQRVRVIRRYVMQGGGSVMSPLALYTADLYDRVAAALKGTPRRHPGRGYLAALRDILNAIGDAIDQDRDPLAAVLAKVAAEAHPRGSRKNPRPAMGA